MYNSANDDDLLIFGSSRTEEEDDDLLIFDKKPSTSSDSLESDDDLIFKQTPVKKPKLVDEEATSLWGHVVAGFNQTMLAEDVSRSAKNLRRRDKLLSDEEVSDTQRREADALDKEINRTLSTFKHRQKAMRKRPMSKEAEELLKGDDIWGAIKRGGFGLVGELTARSAFPSVKSGALALAGGLVGLISGGPIGAVAGASAGAIAGSGDTEFDHHVLQAMQEHGVDIHDRQSLEKTALDDNIMAEIYSDALIRAGVVGTFDGIAQATAFLRLVPKGLKNKVVKGLTEGLTQMALQGALGGSGEALAQLAVDGELQLGEIAAEVLGEFGTAPIEIGVAVLSKGTDAPRIKFDEELGRFVPETGSEVDMGAADKANTRLAEKISDALYDKVTEDADTEGPSPGDTQQEQAETVVAETGGDALDQAIAGSEGAAIDDEVMALQQEFDERPLDDTNVLDALKIYAEEEAAAETAALEEEEIAEEEADEVATESEPESDDLRKMKEEHRRISRDMETARLEITPEPEETVVPEPEPEETVVPEPEPEETVVPEPEPEETVVPEPEPEETVVPEPVELSETAKRRSFHTAKIVETEGVRRSELYAKGEPLGSIEQESPGQPWRYVDDAIAERYGAKAGDAVLEGADATKFMAARKWVAELEQEVNADDPMFKLPPDERPVVQEVFGETPGELPYSSGYEATLPHAPKAKLEFSFTRGDSIAQEKSYPEGLVLQSRLDLYAAAINKISQEKNIQLFKSRDKVSLEEAEVYEYLYRQGFNVQISRNAFSVDPESESITRATYADAVYATEDGRPVFALRLLDGQSIDPRAPEAPVRLKATHNLRVNNFKDALKKGRLLAPSIAVQEESVENTFGYDGSSVSVVFKPSAIKWGVDPVFADDAYTPEHPSISAAYSMDDVRNAIKQVMAEYGHPGIGEQDARGYGEKATVLNTHGIYYAATRLASSMYTIDKIENQASLSDNIELRLREILPKTQNTVSILGAAYQATDHNILLAMGEDYLEVDTESGELTVTENRRPADEPAAIEDINKLLQADALSMPDNRMNIYGEERIDSVEEARKVSMLPPNRSGRERLLEAKPLRAIPLTEIQSVIVSPHALTQAEKTALSDVGVKVVIQDSEGTMSLADLQSPNEALFSLPDGLVLNLHEYPRNRKPGQAGTIDLELTTPGGTYQQGGISASVLPSQGSIRINITYDLSPELRNKKIGIEMYNRLLTIAEDQDLKLESDSVVSLSAARVYEALRRRGAEVTMNPSAELIEDDLEGGMTYISHDMEPVFTVRAPEGLRLKIGDFDDGYEPGRLSADNKHNMIENAVSKAADRILKTGKINSVIVVRSVDELPDSVQEQMRRQGVDTIEGVYVPETNDVYIVSEAHSTVAAAERTLLHELIAHGGLRAVFGNRLNGILDDVWRNGNRRDIETIAKKYGYDTSKINQRRKAVEEYIARIAESLDDTPTIWQKVVDAVRRVLANMGFGVWNETAIRDMLKRVRTSLERKNVLLAAQPVPLTENRPRFKIVNDISAVPLLTDKEQLNLEENAVSVRGMRATVSEVAAALQARTLLRNRGRDLSARTRRNKELLARTMAQEAEHALQQQDNAESWYEQSIEDMVDTLSAIYPELRTDVQARSAFMLGLAITSIQTVIKENMRVGIRVYEDYKKKNKFPAAGSGVAGTVMRKQFARANTLIAKYGHERFFRFLSTDITVNELRSMGFHITGEKNETVTKGSRIFGPKVGGGFYQNLMGNYEPVTVDRWLMRTWGRLTGTMIKRDWAEPAAQTDKFKRIVNANLDQISDIAGGRRQLKTIMRDPIQRVRFANLLSNLYSDSLFEANQEIADASRELYRAASKPITKISPASGTERQWIREVVGEAVRILKQTRPNMTPAQLQALLWYPEKELYGKYGAVNERAEPTDYAIEARRYVVERQEREGEFALRPGGPITETESGGLGAGGIGRVPTAAAETEQAAKRGKIRQPPSLTQKELAKLTREEVVFFVRSQTARGYKPGSNEGRMTTINGIEAVMKYVPEPVMRNRYARIGMSTPTMIELPMGAESARVFVAKLERAKGQSAFGASVAMEVPEEYARSRLFLSDDGTKGFALTDGNIHALFNTPGTGKHSAQAMVNLAVAEGGNRLDAFDTVLPELYSYQGFRAVSRIAFDPEFAPADWSTEKYAKFNDGKPDIVFMAYDPQSTDVYKAGDGKLVKNYSTAVAVQKKAVDKLVGEALQKRESYFSIPDQTQGEVSADPMSPLSRLRKLVGFYAADGEQRNASAYELIKETISSNTIKTTLAAVPRRALVDFLPEELAPSLKRYIQLTDLQAGRRNELQTESDDIVHAWRNWAKNNKEQAAVLGEVMHISTLVGQDPSKKYDPIPGQPIDKERMREHANLVKLFNTMPDEAKQLYTEVRDAYVRMRDMMEAALIKRIEASEDSSQAARQALVDKLRKQFESNRVRGPYFPLTRYGDLWASAKDEKGNVVAFARFETDSERKRWTEAVSAKGLNVDQGRRMDDSYDMVQSVNPEFVAKVMGAVQDTDMQDEIWQMYLSTLPEMSVRKHFIHRKGRLGFSLDALRNFASFSFHSSAQQARLEYGRALNKAISSFKKEVRAIENDPGKHPLHANWAAPLFNEVVSRHKASMVSNTHPLSAVLTAAGFDLYLTASVASAAVNMSQLALVTFPILAAEYGEIRAFAELNKAIAWTLPIGSQLHLGTEGVVKYLRKNGETKLADAVWRQYKQGLFGKTQAHELASLGSSAITASMSNISDLHRSAAVLFHGAEVVNRMTTFIAAYRLSEKTGGANHEQAGIDITWDTHFMYDQENRPVVLQGNVARVLTLFMQYSLNMTYLLARTFNDSFRGETKAQKRTAQKKFAGLIAMSYLFTGFMGLPAVVSRLTGWLIEVMFSDEDDPFDTTDAMHVYLADALGETAAKMIMYGAPEAVTPFSVSDRLSYGNLWFHDPHPLHSDERQATELLLGLMGPLPSYAMDLGVKAPRAMQQGDLWRGTEFMMPKSIRDVMKAIRLSTEGETTRHIPARTIVAKEDIAMTDIAAQLMGFRPSSLAFQTRENIMVKKRIKSLEERRALLTDRYMLMLGAEDEKGIEEALDAIGRWNTKNPGWPIKELSQVVRTRYRGQSLSQHGVLTSESLYYVLDEMNIHNIEKNNE